MFPRNKLMKFNKVAWNFAVESRIFLSTKNHSKSEWIGTVGLEVHAQLNSQSKLFSGASTAFGCPVNSNVSYFDAAVPGTLPVLNRKCVESAVMTALALNCKLNPVSTFDRKHYFYADLPAGYQITQQRQPIATNGYLSFHVFTPGVHKKPYVKKCRIKQVQLEQDSGKSLHDEVMQRSLIDLNRAGVGLIEIVFEPELSNGEEAAALVKELSLILTSLNVCSCKMEEGALRVDVNVSIREPNESKLGVRSEVKNISSVRGVCKAIECEIDRHISLKKSNQLIVNETRAWDPDTSSTLPMRDKEVKQDYRFMPEPNLPPLRLNLGNKPIDGLVCVEDLKSQIPPLPSQMRENIINSYGLTLESAVRLVNEPVLYETFFKTMELYPDLEPKRVSNILINEVLTFYNKGLMDLSTRSLNAKSLGILCKLLDTKTISTDTSRKVLEEILTGLQDPEKFVIENNLCQINDEKVLIKLCQEVIDGNKKIVDQYKAGKKKVFPALIKIIARKHTRANLEMVSTILKDMLD